MLQCVNQVGGGNNDLVWVPSLPVCPSFDGYFVYGSTVAAGPFTQVATVTDPAQGTFSHVNVNAPGVIWYYYVVQSCGGILSPPSDTIDNQVPIRPVVEVVTIVNGQPMIIWQPGLSPETAAYVVYIESPPGSGADVVVDTVWGDTFYVDPNAQATQRPERYRVTAMDACGEESLRSAPHKTIFLSQTTDRCSQAVSLSWTLYEGWTQGIGQQEVWLGLNGAAPQLWAVLSATATSYAYQASDGDTICLSIRAYRSGSTVFSASNEVCFVPEVNRPVQYNFFQNATVVPAGFVALTWLLDGSADVASVRLQAASAGGAYAPLPPPGLPVPAQFNTTDARPDFQSGPVSYVLELTDSCGGVVASDSLSTIYLQAISGGNFTNVLTWTPWVPASGTVTGYAVWRVLNGTATLAATVAAATTLYTDPIDPNTEAEAELCYFVVAATDLLLPDGTVLPIETRSNTACAQQNAVVWVPNAFVPRYGSPNAEFRAVSLFGGNGPFSLQVFDRWGGQVFATDDLDAGWDGTKNGVEMPGGVYVWFLQLQQPDGTLVEQKGTVLLIR